MSLNNLYISLLTLEGNTNGEKENPNSLQVKYLGVKG